MRKNHSRQLESLQAMVDNESRSKAELAKMRKKIEGDMGDLEGSLDASNRSNAEQAKLIKKLQAQLKEVQAMVDDEARGRDEMRDQATRSDRRANDLTVQLDEARAALENSDRARKLACGEKQ